MELRTDDLFLAAYALTRGAAVAGVDMSGRNGRRLAFVRLTGEGLAELEREYLAGRATANVTVLRDLVRHVKDVMFAAIRSADEKEERETRRERHDHPHDRALRRAAR